ncbi:MAG: ATPase [Clostridia bacterium]|nr:ATPase [Clostridia bacterium]
MAISTIKCLRVIGVREKLAEAARVLAMSQCFQPDDPLAFHSDIKMFVPVSAVDPNSELLDRFTAAASSCDVEFSITDISGKEFTDETIQEAAACVDKLNEFTDKRIKLEDQISQCEKEIDQIKHFLDLDLEIDKINQCRYIKANFGRLPKESFEKMQAYSDNPFVIFFPTSSDDDFYWGLYISPIGNSEDVDRIFSGLYFESSGVLDFDGKPGDYYEQKRKLLPELKQKLENLKAELENYKKENADRFNFYYSWFTDQQKQYDIAAKAATYSKSFIIVGWVPAEDADEVVEKLEKIESIECSLTDGKKEMKHSPPVRLKNNFFTKAFSYFTEMYGLPSYNEFDPTGFIAITYTILFGIMFGDVGHGIVVALFGAFMKKKKNPLGSILIPCGISGAIFGAIYGSVFGYEHLLDPVFHALFGLEEKPIEVMKPATTNMIIYIAIGIGVFLVTLAILLNIIISFKTNDKEEAIFGNNGVAGFVLYVSVVAALICSVLLGVSIANPVYILCLIVIPVLMIYLKEPLGKLAMGKKEWQPESWGGYCIQSFFELFEYALSYVTNTMSFLRVGAFVLVHAGMMEVVFTLANMSSGFGYVAIVIVGNIFVMGLEALLVCIQVLRLEFYEMFGRFYKGNGRAFTPIKALADR